MNQLIDNLIMVCFVLFAILSVAFISFLIYNSDVFTEQAKQQPSRITVEGLWLKNYNRSGALETAYDVQPDGRWVCVNINNMSYERMLEVVAHETSHEMFANSCQSNPEQCFDAINKIKVEVK